MQHNKILKVLDFLKTWLIRLNIESKSSELISLNYNQ